jgi:sulfur transfer complex TusBCD TusB component (DsrH family)
MRKCVIHHEHGNQTVEWVGVGAMLVLLIVAIYGVLEGNVVLRDAVSRTVDTYAINFGKDVIARGPTIPDAPLNADLGRLRITIDPETGQYRAYDPETGRTYTVSPTALAQASVDSSQNLISLAVASLNLTALINPSSGDVVIIDHDTGVRRRMRIEDLEEMAIVDIS